MQISAAGYSSKTQGNYSLYTTDPRATVNLSGGQCQGVNYVSSEGLIAGRWWEFSAPSGGYTSEAVTVWEHGRAREALARVLRCWPDNGAQLVRTGDWYIEANFWDYEQGSKTTDVRAFAVAGDAVVSMYLTLTGTRDEIVAQAHDLLDPVVATVKARGLH